MSTWNDPSPLANPLNSSRTTNTSFRRGCISYVRKPASELEVPNQDIPPTGSSEWYEAGRRNDLRVPNQDVSSAGSGVVGFLPWHDSLFRLADGTVLDFRTGKILAEPRA